MGCNCKWTEIIIAIVVFVMVMWPGLLGTTASKWIAAIAAVVLFIHALMLKDCSMCHVAPGSKKMPMAAKKKRR